ncbi:MAG: hypothetical protein COX49_08310 [bacterium (Candidatus Stahlbacteria) CG23_combo_of_CG06-09_8_20_14_all_40_9]|nr:MAG: hypothetical protein COX49_08310 [bacterium (Candidatus Stahlbacteria) CG23_combo_of_CG06-09_8_20_14_all_40_9]
MEYRLNKEGLLERLSIWNGFFKRRVHLIACGGTAMTLLDVKSTTKDVDLIVPDEDEYDYLIKMLKQLGYKSVTGAGWRRKDIFVFELFRGKRVHTTELLESPLKEGNNILIKEFSYIYLGALNYYDLIISKIFRGTTIDEEDCLALIKARKNEIDIGILKQRYRDTASFDVCEEKVNKNLDYFLDILKKEGLYDE